MGTEIHDLFASVPGLKADYVEDWVEDARADWRVDWDATAGTPPVNTVLPVITGTTTIGDVLTCSQGTWTGTAVISYTFQWYRNGVAIGGETAATHTIVSADAGTTLTCTVTATNANGVASETDAQAVPAIAPVNTVLPAITGTAQDGVELSASTGTWTGQPTPTFTYQWFSDTDNVGGGAVAIVGATAATFTPGPSHVGLYLFVTVTATNSAGVVAASSAYTAAVIAA